MQIALAGILIILGLFIAWGGLSGRLPYMMRAIGISS